MASTITDSDAHLGFGFDHHAMTMSYFELYWPQYGI